jgi:hypothetical protein
LRVSKPQYTRSKRRLVSRGKYPSLATTSVFHRRHNRIAMPFAGNRENYRTIFHKRMLVLARVYNIRASHA